ncbi:hypothetical protein [Helicobacter sp.]|uniref:hypothetical protein n=1 Tax=Helicobacter sp. TaxID=218 RepID=UPI0025BDCE2E|nr:hypothetical protein [Helicobacter sp.]MBR2495221.1 hypothetical protein [Helicobacter sp.]
MGSAYGLESRITSSLGVDRPLILSALRDLQNHDSGSTILESQTGEGIDSSLESPNSKRRSNKRLQLGFYCSSTCEIKLNDKTNIIEQNPIYLVDRASK